MTRSLVRALAFSLCLLPPLTALAQPIPKGTGSDVEVDPDAPPAPPPEEKPLPPVDPTAWGVGGKEDEGKFAPSGKTGALRREEEERAAEAREKRVLGPPGSVGVDAVIGFGSIHVPTNDRNPTDVTAFSFVGGASYRIGDTWTLGLRLPFSTGSSTGPQDGTADDYNTFAFGNLEASVAPTFHVSSRIRIPVRVGLALPTAAGDLFAADSEQGKVAQGILNQSASQSRGYEESALFASKRFGFVPQVGFGYDRGALHLDLWTKLEIMKKTGGNDPKKAPTPDAQGKLHDPSTAWLFGLQGSYDLFGGRLTPQLRMWLDAVKVPVVVGVSRDYSGAQFVMEPQVMGNYPIDKAKGRYVSGGLGFILPLGGSLGGAENASISGLRVKAAFLF